MDEYNLYLHKNSEVFFVLKGNLRTLSIYFWESEALFGLKFSCSNAQVYSCSGKKSIYLLNPWTVELLLIPK